MKKIIIIPEETNYKKHFSHSDPILIRKIWKLYIYNGKEIYGIWDDNDIKDGVSLYDRVSIDGNIVKYSDIKVVSTLLKNLDTYIFGCLQNWTTTDKESIIKFQLAWNLIQ